MRKNRKKEAGEQPLYEINHRKYHCPFQLTISIIEGKWKLKIIKLLSSENTFRYGKLKKGIPGDITHKMLVQSLRQLEADGIVTRIVYPEVPPRVEYGLTSEGKRIIVVIEAMSAFGKRYKKPYNP
jgi:DNA-binding HxlR family transcriptional regulator